MAERYDVVVIGAGWFGLAAAKQYLELHPGTKLAVFEGADSCGGTWAKSRLYPGLKSNNMIGTYEYPDFPMSEDIYGVKPFTHIPAAVLHRYLTDFAKKFGVLERVQFHTTVDVVKPSTTTPDGWTLQIAGPQGKREVETAKLIVATGLTSTPNLPVYPGAESFNAPLFHAKDFCKQAPSLEKQVTNTVVVGGGKSAFDVAYAMVQMGSTVDLVVRPDGKGPVWIAPMFVTPFKKRLDQLLHLRWMTWFSPCPWGGEDGFGGIRNWLHGTRIGRWFVDTFWSVLSGDVLTLNAYDSHPELAKLKPWHSAFWIGSGLSILNYDTPVFDLIKDGRIRVHIDNIASLSNHTVTLQKSGAQLPADALICSTGWKKESSLKFTMGADTPNLLGLKYTDEIHRQKMNAQADADVLAMFPRLANQPDMGVDAVKPNADPLRLYRFMVPSSLLHTRNIAFAGMVSTVSTSICAYIQGLWISTYLDGNIDRIASTQQEITQEIMLHTQWGKWRYPCGYGASLPDFVFEALPYMDLLLRDLGLNNHRKGSWIKEVASPYSPGDFDGVVGEWKGKHPNAKVRPVVREKV